MRQSSLQSSWDEGGKKAALICKIAFRTIPRCGKAALLLLTLGLYLLLCASVQALELHQDRAQPWEMVVKLESASADLGWILDIDGVDRITPVIWMEETIGFAKAECTCRIEAVHSSFPVLTIQDGTMFPEQSNMPHLILNRAAAEALSVGVDGEIQLGGKRGVVCGIFEDGEESPLAYMSYDTARRLFPQEGSADLLIGLTEKGMGPGVAVSLQKRGLDAPFEEATILQWRVQTQQVGLFLLAAGGFAMCAGMLMAANRRWELEKQEGELEGLLLLGLTKRDTGKIIALRILFAAMLCLLLAITAAACFRVT